MHGGKRTGAGRPKINMEERNEQLTREMLIPALNLLLTKDNKVALEISHDDLVGAFGPQGLKIWKHWFKTIHVGQGLGEQKGATKSKWLIDKSMVSAAKKLVGSSEGISPFPTDCMKEKLNLSLYNEWCRKYRKYATELNVKDMAVPEYVAYTNPKSTVWNKNYIENNNIEVYKEDPNMDDFEQYVI